MTQPPCNCSYCGSGIGENDDYHIVEDTDCVYHKYCFEQIEAEDQTGGDYTRELFE